MNRTDRRYTHSGADLASQKLCLMIDFSNEKHDLGEHISAKTTNNWLLDARRSPRKQTTVILLLLGQDLQQIEQISRLYPLHPNIEE